MESLRIGLNRAYGMVEMRIGFCCGWNRSAMWWWARRRHWRSASLIVLGPLLFRTALRHAPWLEPLEGTFTFLALRIASVVLIVALLVAHKWLPTGRRRVHRDPARDHRNAGVVAGGGHRVRPLSGPVLGQLREHYAGLASAMIALMFLYWTASIFIYGGELNAAILRMRSRHEPRRRAPDRKRGVRSDRARLDHVIEGTQSRPRRVDQNRHVAGRMPVDSH